MDDLNAQQIVLLTLLVSFVTSIATGITTVSLLEQAPEPVTQTINRVVEKTIERVVEVESEEEPKTIERIVETVVVNAEDLTIEAVAKNSKNIARVFRQTDNLREFVTIGLIISANGNILVDSQKIIEENDYFVSFNNTEQIKMQVFFREANNQFAILSASDDSPISGLSTASFADSNSLKLAQSVISLSGQNSNTVSTGIITSLDKNRPNTNIEQITEGTEQNNNIGEPTISINTSLNSADIVSGSILINLNGEIIGARINSDPNKPSSFLPSNYIKEFINKQNSLSLTEDSSQLANQI